MSRPITHCRRRLRRAKGLYKVCTCNGVVVVVGTTRPSRAPYRVGVPEFQVDALWRRCGNSDDRPWIGALGHWGIHHVTAGCCSYAVDKPAVWRCAMCVAMCVARQPTPPTHARCNTSLATALARPRSLPCLALPCPASPRYHHVHARPAPVRPVQSPPLFALGHGPPPVTTDPHSRLPSSGPCYRLGH
jgi:hypothetical protein